MHARYTDLSIFRVHSPVALMVRASREECLRTLMMASRPSQERLHLRNLFSGGRRYYVQADRNGFRLRSNSKPPWGSRRQRTRFAATVVGTLSELSDGITLVRLRAHINLLYALGSLLVPAWIGGLVLVMPWPRLLTVALVAALFSLSLLGYRFNAALQAGEMMYFVQKALEDLPAAELPALTAAAPDIVTPQERRDFREQWQKFYEQHRDSG